jgi:hypothetical protein
VQQLVERARTDAKWVVEKVRARGRVAWRLGGWRLVAAWRFVAVGVRAEQQLDESLVICI